MGATFDGHIYTRYVFKTQAIGEWRELTNYQSSGRKTQGPGVKKSRYRSRDLVNAPRIFVQKFYPNTKSGGKLNAAKFILECYLGRQLESFEVCRHGIAGPNDHSYLNVSPGDAVNNMIDDLENGKSETNLTYLIQAQQRIARLISQRQFHSTNQ